MRDQTIVCMAPRRWDALWKETQAIMSRLAAHNRVLYFEPGRDPEYGVLAEMRRNAPNLSRPAMRHVQGNLIVIPSPPVLPHGRQLLPPWVLRVTMPPMIAINARVLVRHVRRTLRALAIREPILWLTDPYQLPLLGRFGEKLACYFNFDEFADIAANRRVSGLLRRLDDELTRRADVIFATSRSQAERRQRINPQTHFVPNAVDFDLFHRAVTDDLPVPADVVSLPRPIIGFVGWLTVVLRWVKIRGAFISRDTGLILMKSRSPLRKAENIRQRTKAIWAQKGTKGGLVQHATGQGYTFFSVLMS